MSKSGYKNPPANHQWKKGQSGNPAGRPKREASFRQEVADAAFKPVSARDASGRTKRYHPYEVGLTNFCKAALTGSPAQFVRNFLVIETLSAEAFEQKRESEVEDPVHTRELARLGFKIVNGELVDIDDPAPE